MYTAFSQVYDALMRDVDYRAWARHYQALLITGGVTGGRVCECACGTGSLTVQLSKLGYQMTGLDESRGMLNVAVQKARDAGQAIPFVMQDMCALQLPRAFDAILCTCDGLNYLTTPERVNAFFARASATLREGGVFAFDLSTPEKLAQTLGDHTLGDLSEKLPYIWQNSYCPTTRCVHMALSVFAKREDGAYSRVDENQTQRAHGMDELTRMLEENGFDDITWYGEQRMDAPRAGDTRWHARCKKRGNIK